jgi:hypothetical protein
MKKKLEEVEALKTANSDIQKEKGKSINFNTQSEEYLEEFYDDRNSTKEDVFYEEGDGMFEIFWKKLTRKINKKNYNLKTNLI